MSIRVPVTETFQMAWSKPVLTINNQGAAPVSSTSWVSSNTTMVGCICPFVGFPYDDLINRYGNAAHPNLVATQARIPAGRAPAVNQKLYNIYSNMYDEVKLDGMTVSLSILTPVGGADLSSVSVATSWDRKGGIPEVAPLYEYGNNRDDVAINNVSLYPIPAQGTTANYNMVISRDYPNTYEELIGGSSATEATAINNSVAKIFRSCRASDLMERNVFHDCTLRVYTTHTDVYYDAAWDTTGASAGIGFAPTFYFACKRPDIPAGADQTITLQAEVNYYFTFRNPKFGGTSFDPIASAAVLNRAIAEGTRAMAAAQEMAAQEEPMDANRSLRSSVPNYYNIPEDEDMIEEPETTSTMGFTSSGRSVSDTGNKSKKRRIKDVPTEMEVHDESTQMPDTAKSKRMDSKSGMK